MKQNIKSPITCVAYEPFGSVDKPSHLVGTYVMENEIWKDIIGFELFTDFSKPVTLVEGVFDAFSVKYNVIPLFGKTLSDKLKIKLIHQKPPRVNVLLDNDALKSSLDICEFLIHNGIDAHLVLLDGKDPNELGHINTWKAIDASGKITDGDLFKLKIKNFKLRSNSSASCEAISPAPTTPTFETLRARFDFGAPATFLRPF